MRIALGCDHSGFEGPPFFKEEIAAHVRGLGHEIVDCGTFGPESCDYPDFANNVCEAILSGKADEGVLLCGTGIGISIAANRHPGIRAAVCTTEFMAEMAREHNNANIICLGRRVLSLDLCKSLLNTWFQASFKGGERHERRVAKLG